MKIGLIGLGRMGFNMALNLLEKKNNLVVYDLSKDAIKKLEKKGAIGASSIKDLIAKLPKQKIVWIMIPAGKPVDQTLAKIVPLLSKGDIIIDGGNSFYKDTIKRGLKLRKKGIEYLDCGTSGGIEGARHGACMMIGGPRSAFKRTEKLYKDMCVKDGYGYMGNSGAGHFVKMVHNGIEYGMMGALAEGIDAIKNKSGKFKTNLLTVSKVYANGSIIESKLASWLLRSYETKGYLEKIAGSVPKGETEEEMKYLESISNMNVLKAARLMRVKSRKRPNYKGRLVAAMRNQFGGHKVNKRK